MDYSGLYRYIRLNTLYSNIVQENPLLIMLVGLPGSGKSTYSEKMKAKGFSIISADDIAEAWGQDLGKTMNEAYNHYGRPKIYEEVRTQVRRLTQARKNIVWDQTNLSKAVRAYRLIDIPDYYIKQAIVFKKPLSLIKKNLKEREERTGKFVPFWKMDKFIKEFQMPTENEGFSKITIFR